jgi:hypothetical protein
MNNVLIMVLGMHRSGTSCTAGLLYHLGVYPGPLEHLLPANESNVKGYWENSFLTSANNRICETLYGSWIDAQNVIMTWENMARIWHSIPDIHHILIDYLFVKSPSFLKDPRLCVLLPVYFKLFEDMRTVDTRFIIVNRPKEDVIASISAVHGYDHDRISITYDRYYGAAMNNTHGFQRSIVEFYDILRDPMSVLYRISKEINLVWPRDPLGIQEEIYKFVSPSLRHYYKKGEEHGESSW